MVYDLRLSEEELRTVRQILEQELETIHTELRRTHNVDYKEQVRRRMESISQALHAIGLAAEGSETGKYVPA